MTTLESQLGLEWATELASTFEAAPMRALRAFLRDELCRGATVYPQKEQVFRALKLTPLSQVRVVWLGQDPYHGPGQAEGLSFSVKHGVPIPPSLMNIFKELQDDKGVDSFESGSLLHWALQGILLLNTTLTVRAGEPLSHQGQGWEFFTDTVIEKLAAQNRPICFVLLGRHARAKKKLIEKISTKHHLIEAAHPSPLSAYRGFLGSNIFSQIDIFLESLSQSPIVWDRQAFKRLKGDLLSTQSLLPACL